MKRRVFLGTAMASAAAFSLSARGVMAAAKPFEIGLILPMTGPFASTGRQIEAAVRLYIAQNGDEVAGRKIEIVLRDDASVADATKRHAQELIVRGLDPSFPLKILVYVMIVVTIGGTSSLTGPFIAALIIGVADVAGKYYLPELGAFLIYLMMIVLLVLRPQGLIASGR